MNPNLILAASRAGAALPEAVLRGMLRAGLTTDRMALCFHRVAEPGAPAAGMPAMTIAAPALEELLAFFLSVRSGSRAPWLTVCFDDGYEDSAVWLARNAARYPSVEFLYFVCPAKVEQGAGFRWDLADAHRRRNAYVHDPARPLFDAPLDPSAESAREDLKAIGREAAYRLADLARCRQLQALPNVRLGNHTNHHFDMTRLPPERLREELVQSKRDFERLFGASEDFAIPFGTPGLQFTAEHVALLREIGSERIWSTERRPYAAEERRPGGVLPRFAIDGTLAPRQIAWLLATWSLRYRVLGPRFRFAPPGAAAPEQPERRAS